jgi:hypothetical protein
MEEILRNSVLDRFPVQPESDLWFRTQAREQVLIEHPGHEYLGGYKPQVSQTGSSSPASMDVPWAIWHERCKQKKYDS